MSDRYESPLGARYASREMQRIFSDDEKFTAWRRLWCSLARHEMELGVPITEAQVAELEAHITDIDYAAAAKYEQALRHDVMAHIRAYGDACPGARGIIHLGATSCFVDDNGDVLAMRAGLGQLRGLLLAVISTLTDFAAAYQDTPTLAYTHFQAAQPTTAGKRACLWLQDFISDLEKLDWTLERLSFPGCKGATGTAASFLSLLDGDGEQVLELEKRIAADFGFARILPLAGQTYSRKLDADILALLSGMAQSASKMATDLRLLAHLKEFDEPFEAEQVGSSAMAYKRNPMRCERICALSRYVILDAQNPAITAATQWLERSLDDSANRRLSIPEAFLAVDGILGLCANVIAGGRLYPKTMEAHLLEELPFLATENILMDAVRRGGDRQALHEVIRQYSVETARNMKERGGKNDLFPKLLADPRFGLTEARLGLLADPKQFTGMAAAQCAAYLRHTARPLLAANPRPGAVAGPRV